MTLHEDKSKIGYSNRECDVTRGLVSSLFVTLTDVQSTPATETQADYHIRC